MSSMAKAQKEVANEQVGFFANLLQFGFYKPNQGKVVRQLTGASIALVSWLGAFEFSTSPWVSNIGFEGASFALLVVLGVLGLWLAYRVVNYPKFADFLIAVEAEMKKVSWPARGELVRASVVVIFVIFSLAVLLFGFDIVWNLFFKLIGIRHG